MTTTAPIDWHQRARALSINGQAFIDGQYVPAASGATFDDLSPLDGRLLAQGCSDRYRRRRPRRGRGPYALSMAASGRVNTRAIASACCSALRN